jgi:hypothetical protein
MRAMAFEEVGPKGRRMCIELGSAAVVSWPSTDLKLAVDCPLWLMLPPLSVAPVAPHSAGRSTDRRRCRRFSCCQKQAR